MYPGDIAKNRAARHSIPITPYGVHVIRSEAVWHCDGVAYGISSKSCMSSSRRGGNTRLRVMPCALGDSIQCASALMTCQACCLYKTRDSEPVFAPKRVANCAGNLRKPCMSRCKHRLCWVLSRVTGAPIENGESRRTPRISERSKVNRMGHPGLRTHICAKASCKLCG